MEKGHEKDQEGYQEDDQRNPSDFIRRNRKNIGEQSRIKRSERKTGFATMKRIRTGSEVDPKDVKKENQEEYQEDNRDEIQEKGQE